MPVAKKEDSKMSLAVFFVRNETGAVDEDLTFAKVMVEVKLAIAKEAADEVLIRECVNKVFHTPVGGVALAKGVGLSKSYVIHSCMGMIPHEASTYSALEKRVKDFLSNNQGEPGSDKLYCSLRGRNSQFWINADRPVAGATAASTPAIETAPVTVATAIADAPTDSDTEELGLAGEEIKILLSNTLGESLFFWKQVFPSFSL
jgi:hypothetical protein